MMPETHVCFETDSTTERERTSRAARIQVVTRILQEAVAAVEETSIISLNAT
jgi:hypothetical protein